MMSLFGGRLPGIASVTCNSVALTPRVPAWSRLLLRAQLEILPGYGHLDPIVGKDAHLDVFPRICQFLRRQAA